MAGAAGAGVALADEPTGPVRNPAGLALVPGVQGSLSMSAYQLFIQRQESLVQVGETSVDLDVSRLSTFPAALATSVELVGPGEDGTGRHVLAVEILVPAHDEWGGRLSSDRAEATSDALGATFDFEEEAQTFQFGVAWAFQPSSLVRVGAMVSYVLDLYSFSLLTSLDAESFVFGYESQSFHGLAGSLLFDAGVQLQLAPQWVLGVAVQSQSVPLHAEGEGLLVVGLSGDGTTSGEQLVTLYDDLTFQRRHPWRVSFGGAYLDPDGWRLALDLYLHLGTPDHLDIAIAGAPSFTDGGQVADEQVFGDNQGRNVVLDGAFGAEIPVAEWLVIRSGLLTSLSPYPEPDPANPSRPARVHNLGATLGLTYPSEHSTLSVAFSYMLGFGQDLATRAELDGTVTQERIDVIQHRLTALVGGSVAF
jgi:hypothetical protein